MRKAHYLNRNSKSESPSWFVFLDVETKERVIDESKIEAKLWFGYACFYRRYTKRNKRYDSEEWKRFETHNEFWSWLESLTKAKTKLYIFAHNMSFEFQVMAAAENMEKLGYKANLIIIDSPPFLIQYRKQTTTILFTDTMNYFPLALEKLGKGIGFDKLIMPKGEIDINIWNEYCKRDVEVIKKAMLMFIDFVKENDLGNFQKTLASQAFAAYRHRFMRKPILIHSDEIASEVERLSYCGGRTEPFKLGKFRMPFELLDVNSMYPAVMLNNEFPYQYVCELRNVDLTKLNELLSLYCITAKCTIKTNENVYPYRNNGKLCFPIGQFITYLSTPEIKYAIDHKHLQSIEQCFVYRKSRIFHSFIEELYNLRLKYRLEGNTAYDFMIKILMNCLYGKFGQAGRKWVNIVQTSDYEFDDWIEVNSDTGESTRFRKALGLVQMLETEPESFNSFPAIAAHVTAYARLLLYSYIKQAKAKNVYYCDTDSLLVTKEGFNNLSDVIDANTLGKLKHEKSLSYVELCGAKDYTFDDVIKIKGIRKTAKVIAENVYQQEKFWSLKTATRNKLENMQVIETVTKHLTRQYNKGDVKPNGDIKPFLLSL